MAKIIIDGKTIECRDGVPVLQAALEGGWDVPHYCYHPSLKVVASCRLCLMEMKVPNPRTGDIDWSPKLFPSCQTPVRDGLEVRFDSETVRSNQQHVMEYYLINHPLDCPVCDQAGECYLQDYSEKFGSATSRMVDAKTVNPKKDIGPKTLLYQDRCVMCSRCVRFTEEISGTHELCIVNRGNRSEIDVFPGKPLDNKLQGNVVDICPVGCLLDKDFLFKQRVWFLKSADTICPNCSTGCAIHADSNKDKLWRVKPRFNPDVNDYWICDEGRFGWKYVHDEKRITKPLVRRGVGLTEIDWPALADALDYRFRQVAKTHDGWKTAVVLSPFMACEEAWLLATAVRRWVSGATIVMGPVPTDGEDEHFPVGCDASKAKFTIRAEKCPNRRGVEMVIETLGGPMLTWEELLEKCKADAMVAVWLGGGYISPWVEKEAAESLSKPALLVLQDLLASELLSAAEFVLPACAWAERSGSFINDAGRLQRFDRAMPPPDGGRSDGQYLFELAGHEGLYTGDRVRAMMAHTVPAFAEVAEVRPKPAHQH